MMKNRIKLNEDLSNCSGCGACTVACPKQALEMAEDDCGYLYPSVNEALCVQCGKCADVCGFHTPLPTEKPIKAFAAVGKNDRLIAGSASGGMFSCLADALLANGGMAAGAVMDLRSFGADVYHLLTEQKEDILRLQGSKYVQSEAWRSYEAVLSALKQGRQVLFSGTPCQIAAIKRLTGDPDNLITVDIVCHGVPSKRMLNGYLNVLGKYLRGTVTALRFRDKSAPKAYTALVETEGKEKHRIRSTFLSYYALFLDGSICRESCYHCPYAKGERVSDLTIGDYWGIKDHHTDLPDRSDWSCLLVNTEKGQQFLKHYEDVLCLYPTEVQWVKENNRQLNEPPRKAKDREALLNGYQKKGYSFLEAAFVRKNGGRLRFYWRMMKHLRDHNEKKHEN